MYNYHGLNERIERPYFTPSDDMLVNGHSLSNIEGYRQLHVSGRGMVSQDPELINVPARAGAFFNYTQDETREIEVTFQLTGVSSNHLRDQYEQLNNVLRDVNNQGLLSLRFIDEPEWEYYAVLADVENKPEQSLQLISSFTLICPDPYKYKDAQESTGSIKLKHAKKVLPQVVEGTVTQLTEEITVSNGDQLITFKGNYKAGDKFKIVWGQSEVQATINDVNKLHELRFFDYPETFYLRNGDQVAGTNLSITRVQWRDRRL